MSQPSSPDHSTTPLHGTLLEQRPDAIYDEIVASVARTAFATTIPYLDAAATSAANNRVEARFGAESRELVILGPDAIAIDSLLYVIRSPRLGEVLGGYLSVRKPIAQAELARRGLLQDAPTHGARKVGLSTTTHRILSTIVDRSGVAVLTTDPDDSGHHTVVGARDIVVVDKRRTRAYQDARYVHSLGVFEGYLSAGGPLPLLAEHRAVEAARRVLSQSAQKSWSDHDQHRRFTLLSEGVAELYTTRTDQYEAEHMMRSIEGQRTEIAGYFEPEWQSEAACRGIEGPFYPPAIFEYKADKLAREARAKEICRGCKLRPACLETALERREPSGVWGGLNELERKQILKNGL